MTAPTVERPVAGFSVGNVLVSDQCGELFAALAAAQAELTDPIKDSSATVQTRAGGSYSYAYVDLAGALRYSRPVLARHGLAVVQWPAVDGDRLNMTTIVTHASGQWMSGDLAVTIPPADRMNPVQAIGSVISYARRYSFLAAVGLAADDDDGNSGAAQTAKREPAKAEPSEPAKPPKPEPTTPDRMAEQKPITSAQHRRLVASLAEVEVPRERVKAWLSRLRPGVYPTADAVHLDKLRAVDLRAIEENLPKFREAVAQEAAAGHAEAQITEAALAYATSRGWGGDVAALRPIADQLQAEASATSQAAQSADRGGVDHGQMVEAERQASLAAALRRYMAAALAEEVPQ